MLKNRYSRVRGTVAVWESRKGPSVRQHAEIVTNDTFRGRMQPNKGQGTGETEREVGKTVATAAAGSQLARWFSLVQV